MPRGGAVSRQPGAHNLLCCCVEEGGEEAFSPAEERGDKVGQCRGEGGQGGTV